MLQPYSDGLVSTCTSPQRLTSRLPRTCAAVDESDSSRSMQRASFLARSQAYFDGVTGRPDRTFLVSLHRRWAEAFLIAGDQTDAKLELDTVISLQRAIHQDISSTLSLVDRLDSPDLGKTHSALVSITERDRSAAVPSGGSGEECSKLRVALFDELH